MRDKRVRTLILILFVLVITSLILSSCTISWDGDLSVEAGREARKQVDQLIDKFSEFVVGFCGSSLLPFGLMGLVVLVPVARKK